VGDGKSIWKKEISFSRKQRPKDEAPAPAETAPVSPSAQVPAAKKKRVSLSRAKPEPKTVPDSRAKPEPKTVPADEAGAAVAKTSFWKKEVSLSRKKRPKSEPSRKKRPRSEPAATSDAAPAKTSFWKKEVTLGRKRKAEAVPEAEPQAVAPGEAEAPVPVTSQAPLEPIVEDEAQPVPEPALEHELEVSPAETGWEASATLPPEPLSDPAGKPESQGAVTAAADPGSEPDPAPAPAADAPETPAADAPESPAADAPETPAADAPETPAAAVGPAPVPVPAAVAPAADSVRPVHPPVPASELPLLETPKTPWWKKEIGGRRRASRLLPEDDDSGDAKRFRRRQISLGRRRAKAAPGLAGTAADPAPVTKPAAAAKPARKRFSLGGPSLSLPSLSLPSLPGVPTLSGARPGRNGKAKRLVGLKIGASQIAAARIANNGAAELLEIVRQPLEQGVVVAGELRDPELLAEQLRAFFARHKLPRRNVRLGIASNRIGVRIFDVVGIDDDKSLANAIQFRAQEALPIPLDEAVLDYHVLGRSVDGEGQPVRRVLLVVAYRELVDRYVAACRKAGIALAGIDLEAFALLRALAAPREDDAPAAAAFVAVSIGHDRSTFAVSDGRVCEFTRVLEWGGAVLSIAIARALDSAPSEVEAIKRSLSLEDGAPPPEGLPAESATLAVDAVRKQIQTFARELVSSLQFYQNQPGSLGISEIVLTGGTAHLPGIAEELQRLIGVNVRVGDPLGRVKIAKNLDAPDQVGSFAVAIGLGIED
jgi:type IV pilus assembly protein PilM